MWPKILKVLLCLFIQSANSSVCFWDSGCPYKYFASKTPYSTVRGDIRDSVIKVKDCAPIAVWALYRHGKSNPNSYYAKKMDEAVDIRTYLAESQEQGNCSLCAQDVENIKKWPIDKKVLAGHNELSDEGYQELYGIGKRLKTVFPDLFSNLQDNEYIIRPTSNDKIEKSVKAFIDGIGNTDLKIEEAKFDDILDCHETCEKYQKEVKENSTTYAEASKYQTSPEYLATKDRIQRRAGITLSDDNITALYDLCRYTWSGINVKPSPWCAMFTSEDLQVLEYLEDLKHYYKNGYGTPMNKMFGHIPLADLLQNFMNIKQGKGKKLTAYFGHHSIVDMTVSALGMFKDEKPLTGAKRYRDRKWRSSKLSNFASNIMAVLSKCDKGDSEKYLVVFYWNENPIRTVCTEAICTWEEFESKIKIIVDTEIDFCELNDKLSKIMNQ